MIRRSARRPRPRRIGTATLVVALLILVALPLVPGVLAAGSPLALIRIPVESLLVVLLLALLPWRAVRRVVAAVFGAFVVVALVFAGLDAAFEYALDIHFDATDWPQVSDGFGVVEDSIGAPAAVAILIGLAVVAVATLVGLAWAALRVDAAIRRGGRRGRLSASAVTAAWVIAALAGSQLVAGQPAAASASIDAIGSATSIASATLSAQADLPQEVADDPYARVPSDRLLTALKGKDVDGALVEAVLQEVDAGIGGNHVLGEVDIGALKGCRGLVDGLCDQR